MPSNGLHVPAGEHTPCTSTDGGSLRGLAGPPARPCPTLRRPVCSAGPGPGPSPGSLATPGDAALPPAAVPPAGSPPMPWSHRRGPRAVPPRGAPGGVDGLDPQPRPAWALGRAILQADGKRKHRQASAAHRDLSSASAGHKPLSVTGQPALVRDV